MRHARRLLLGTYFLTQQYFGISLAVSNSKRITYINKTHYFFHKSIFEISRFPINNRLSYLALAFGKGLPVYFSSLAG